MLTKSAIKVDNTIYTGARHGYILKRVCIAGIPINNAVQGFTDHTGKFYDRAEAEIYARKIGQLSGDICGGELTSEDLW